MNIDSFKKIVLVDDKGTGYRDGTDSIPKRKNCYLDFCKRLSENFKEAVEIVLIVGDGYFYYDKGEDNEKLIFDKTKPIEFPKKYSDIELISNFKNFVVKEKRENEKNKENTLFILDNRLLLEDDDSFNGLLSRHLAQEINNAGGYTIQFSSFETGDDSYENPNHFGYLPVVGVEDPSIMVDEIIVEIKEGGIE